MKPPSEAPSIPRASRAQGHSRPSSKPLLDCAANTLSKWGVGNYRAIALTTAKLSEDQPLADNFLAVCHRNAWLLPFQRQYIDFNSHEFANKLPE
jgi:hypothetical protein